MLWLFFRVQNDIISSSLGTKRFVSAFYSIIIKIIILDLIGSLLYYNIL